LEPSTLLSSRASTGQALALRSGDGGEELHRSFVGGRSLCAPPRCLRMTAGWEDVLLNYSEFVLVTLGVIGANVEGKLLVALQLEVAHHFVEG
jgi:hypothetical protein